MVSTADAILPDASSAPSAPRSAKVLYKAGAWQVVFSSDRHFDKPTTTTVESKPDKATATDDVRLAHRGELLSGINDSHPWGTSATYQILSKRQHIGPSRDAGHPIGKLQTSIADTPTGAFMRPRRTHSYSYYTPTRLQRDNFPTLVSELSTLDASRQAPWTQHWFACSFNVTPSIYLTSLDAISDYSRLTMEHAVEGFRSYEEKYAAAVRELERNGLDVAAGRLGHLQEMGADDPEETPAQLDSLRQLVRFLIAEREMETSRIGVSPDGLVQIEWRTDDRGIIAMKFLLDGKIQFVGFSGAAKRGEARKRVNGTLPKSETMLALQPFLVTLFQK